MLTVYRASAGSGKTHLLTGTYLHLLFSDENTYRNILAVTFTNKATDEMKERIISQLFILSVTPEKSDYFKSLSNDFNFTADQIRNKSSKILIDILHDFSNFNISTIDRFFQQMVRALTREIGLQGGYDIELDDEKIRTEAIDNMLDSLDEPENKNLLDWIVAFAKDKTDNAQSWDIRADLLSLSREILKETYKNHADEIIEFTKDKETLNNFIKILKEQKKNFEEISKENGLKGVELMKQFSLSYSDFVKGKNSPFNYFNRWAKGEIKEPTNTFYSLDGNVEAWYSKTTPQDIKNTISSCYNAGMNSCVSTAVNLYGNMSVLYNSITETLKFIYSLGILADIDRHIRERCKEQNVMLLADTTELLNKIIDGKDTPFIYEKIGSSFNSFMIDEFQDTSGMQWDNFKPLIEESISRGNDNLIVGDVKQSIYRWRNSDWELLHSKLRDFETDSREDCVLETNWRSKKNIVDFNNAFFTCATALLQDKYNAIVDQVPVSVSLDASARSVITEAYYDIYQKLPQKQTDNDGHVRIEFVSDDENRTWKENVLEKLPLTIIELQTKDYSLKDIAILVRSGKEGTEVANELLKYKKENSNPCYKFDVISNESLYISQAPIIKTITAIMTYFDNPSSKIVHANASVNFSISENQSFSNEIISEYFGDDKNGIESFENNIAAQFNTLRKMPLFEMTEKIIELLGVNSNSSDRVYVQAFQDLVMDFTTNNSADLSAFIKWWEDFGVRKTITTPDSQDAIRIITIHKSKGLGFKVVIVPFAGWLIDHDSKMDNIIWCAPKVEPFNMAPLLPISYKSSLANSIFAKEYLDEKRSAYIDNMNIAYVAFTRAKDELIIYAQKEKKPENLNTISSLLQYAIENNCSPKNEREIISLNEHFDGDENIFSLGDYCTRKNDEKKDSSQCMIGDYISIDPSKRLQLRLHGKGYFNEREERLYGNMMHEILSSIKSTEDIDAAVEEYVRSGEIKEADKKEIIIKIKNIVSDKNVYQWFQNDINILNEREILIEDGNFIRPDRIIINNGCATVIDYKFGMVERKSYFKQVRKYMSEIKKMGFDNVEGYLWYVTMGKIVPVEL
ncbi:MAG: UvrD-helicase domain-containing protein [Bacteroidales bacterium]|nr:UvrD-helicase domain-containing protein [Bacteroidales bacterium]